jgi:hypothetical protein
MAVKVARVVVGCVSRRFQEKREKTKMKTLFGG